MGKAAKRKEVPGANLFHDRVNLICLPVLAAMSAAGLMGWYSPEKVGYIAFCIDASQVYSNMQGVV